jgi:hypothetical protein
MCHRGASKTRSLPVGAPRDYLIAPRETDPARGRALRVGSAPKSAFVLTTTPPPLLAKIKLKAFHPPVVGVATVMRIDGEGRPVRAEAMKQHAARGDFALVGKRFVLRGKEKYPGPTPPCCRNWARRSGPCREPRVRVTLGCDACSFPTPATLPGCDLVPPTRAKHISPNVYPWLCQPGLAPFDHLIWPHLSC